MDKRRISRCRSKRAARQPDQDDRNGKDEPHPQMHGLQRPGGTRVGALSPPPRPGFGAGLSPIHSSLRPTPRLSSPTLRTVQRSGYGHWNRRSHRCSSLAWRASRGKADGGGHDFGRSAVRRGALADAGRTRGGRQDGSVPILASTEFGWLADTEFLPPPCRPRPRHLRQSPSLCPQQHGRAADLPHWRPHQSHPAALGGGADERRTMTKCWPAKSPSPPAPAAGPRAFPASWSSAAAARTVYFIQTPKEVTIINEGDQQVRHVYHERAAFGAPQTVLVRRIHRSLRGRRHFWWSTPSA